MKLHIVHLYQKEMNIYGDTGNREVLEYRLNSRGIEYKTTIVNVGDDLPMDADIIIGGGGQDSGQFLVQEDLLKKKDQLHSMAIDGVVMLMVCGMYQLFGDKFITSKKEEIKGIDILPITTRAGKKRLIGNVVAKNTYSTIVGYENHSGLTYLKDGSTSLAEVVLGAGNNGKDKSEGCVLNNVFGTYMHGPVLSKSPELADELLRRALKRSFPAYKLEKIDDSLEIEARKVAVNRPR